MVGALALGVGTYAYYQSSMTGSISGTILEWECKANGSSNNFNLTLGELYPGVSGSFPISLTLKNFKANFTISLASATNVNDLIFKHGETVLCKSTGNPSGCTSSYVETLDATSSGTASKTTTVTYEWPLGEAQTSNIPTTNSSSSIIIRIVCTQANYTPYGA